MKNNIKISIFFLIILGGISILFLTNFSDNDYDRKQKINQSKLASTLKNHKLESDENCRIKKSINFDGLYEIDINGKELETVFDNKIRYKVKEKPSINSLQIKNIFKKATSNPTKFELQVMFSSETAEKYAELTEKNIGKQLLFVVDGKVLAAPMINSKIGNGTFYFEIDKTIFAKFFE